MASHGWVLSSRAAEGQRPHRVRRRCCEGPVPRAGHGAVVAGLVNIAGLTAHPGDLVDTPVDVDRTVVDVNLTGALLCARRAGPVMSTARGGAGGAIVAPKVIDAITPA